MKHENVIQWPPLANTVMNLRVLQKQKNCFLVQQIVSTARGTRMTMELQVGDQELASGDWREAEVLFPL
jgi:hypothetical protein